MLLGQSEQPSYSDDEDEDKFQNRQPIYSDDEDEEKFWELPKNGSEVKL